MNRQYEIMFIFRVMEEITAKKEVAELIESMKGTIFEIKEEGVRSLAYPIKKQDKGFYYILRIELDLAKLKELNYELRLNHNVLRHMIIQLEKKDKNLNLIDVEAVFERNEHVKVAKEEKVETSKDSEIVSDESKTGDQEKVEISKEPGIVSDESKASDQEKVEISKEPEIADKLS